MTLKFTPTNVVHQPDPAVTDCEHVLESLARLERLAIKLKEKACRGSDESAKQLVALNDDVYTLLSEALEDHLRAENDQ